MALIRLSTKIKQLGCYKEGFQEDLEDPYYEEGQEEDFAEGKSYSP